MTHKCCSPADIGFIEEKCWRIFENIFEKNIGFGERIYIWRGGKQLNLGGAMEDIKIGFEGEEDFKLNPGPKQM